MLAVNAKTNLDYELTIIMSCPTGTTSAGFPYLQPAAWRRLRDWVPHLFHHGAAVLAAADRVLDAHPDDANMKQAHAVVSQVVRSAAICAPPDLWVMRSVLHHLKAVGLLEKLADGDTLHDDDLSAFRTDELAVDLRFLLGRGVLVRGDHGGHRLAPHMHAQQLARLPLSARVDDDPLPEDVRAPGEWSPNAYEVEVGARLVPLVVGFAASGELKELLAQQGPLSLPKNAPQNALATLRAAAIVDDNNVLTAIGRRVLERGPGPFGIIETYRGYTNMLGTIWREGRKNVHVERGHNVAASQAANKKSFEEANAALDAFCTDTGFTYSVFVEHALGKGEATRQRVALSGEELHYVGADLEDKAIAAAREEQKRGHLPKDMVFVESADIQDASRIVNAIEGQGWQALGAVMLVGNGFHEVRDQTDEGITEVFAAYQRAGIVVIFTEESALSVDDLLDTAYNTYHAGFRYVHERSGQHLRPAETRPSGALEDNQSRSWADCAVRAGYVRVERYCRRGRTIYPSPPPSGHNPAVSVTHFLVPKALATSLGL